MTNKTYWYIIIGIIIIIAFVGIIQYQGLPLVEDIELNTDADIIIDGEIPEGVSVEITKIDAPKLPIPTNLDRPILLKGGNLPQDIREQTEERIIELSALLKENPDQFNEWIELGQLRKLIEDYEGAILAWDYAGLVIPTNAISYANIGDIYGYYLKDNEKAEENFAKAIENKPLFIQYYGQAALFQRDATGDIEKAKDIIRLGIKNNPFNEDLKLVLEELEAI